MWFFFVGLGCAASFPWVPRRQALYYDYVLNRSQRTVWSSFWTLAPSRTVQANRAFYRDQATGAFVKSMARAVPGGPIGFQFEGPMTVPRCFPWGFPLVPPFGALFHPS